VRAVNAAGESANSPEASATPHGCAGVNITSSFRQRLCLQEVSGFPTRKRLRRPEVRLLTPSRSCPARCHLACPWRRVVCFRVTRKMVRAARRTTPRSGPPMRTDVQAVALTRWQSVNEFSGTN
jgi:hypothetical protein